MCKLCDMRQDMADAISRRTYDPAARALIERGHDVIGQYMAEHGVGFPEAVEALGRERQADFVELRADYAGRHGLDDEQTMFALWAHCVDGTGGVH